MLTLFSGVRALCSSFLDTGEGEGLVVISAFFTSALGEVTGKDSVRSGTLCALILSSSSMSSEDSCNSSFV